MTQFIETVVVYVTGRVTYHDYMAPYGIEGSDGHDSDMGSVVINREILVACVMVSILGVLFEECLYS